MKIADPQDDGIQIHEKGTHIYYLDLDRCSKSYREENIRWGYVLPGWYFIAEDEATWYGPWATKELAEEKLSEYARTL